MRKGSNTLVKFNIEQEGVAGFLFDASIDTVQA